MHNASAERARRVMRVGEALGEPSPFFRAAMERAAAEDARFTERQAEGYRTGALTGIRTQTRAQMHSIADHYGLDVELDFTCEQAALAAQSSAEQERVIAWALSTGGGIPTNVTVFRLRPERPLPSVRGALVAEARQAEAAAKRHIRDAA